MKKAVLYARVSSEAQQRERTIESQVVQLKRQIADNGHALVKEYIEHPLVAPNAPTYGPVRNPCGV
jgi:DNA invertase Pin-like site-specific DNA recombinase